MVTSKRTYTKNHLLGQLPPESLSPQRGTADPPTLAGRSGSVSCGGHCSYPLGLDVHKILCVLFNSGVSVPVPSKSSVKSWQLWKSDSLGTLSPSAKSPGREVWHGAQNLHNTGRASLVLLCSSLWVTHPEVIGFDFIVTLPPYHPIAASPLYLDMEYLFLVCSSVILSVVVQQLLTISVLSWDEIKGFPDSPFGKEFACNAGDPSLIPELGRSAGEGIGYPLHTWAALVVQLVQKSACNVGDLGSIHGLGRSPGEGKGYPLQYLPCRIPWTIHGVTKSLTHWVTFTFTGGDKNMFLYFVILNQSKAHFLKYKCLIWVGVAPSIESPCHREPLLSIWKAYRE